MVTRRTSGARARAPRRPSGDAGRKRRAADEAATLGDVSDGAAGTSSGWDQESTSEPGDAGDSDGDAMSSVADSLTGVGANGDASAEGLGRSEAGDEDVFGHGDEDAQSVMGESIVGGSEAGDGDDANDVGKAYEGMSDAGMDEEEEEEEAPHAHGTIYMYIFIKLHAYAYQYK